MAIHPLAGKAAPAELLIDAAKLEKEYYERRPDVGDARQMVSFGTSGHRGTPKDSTFTEAHILAITQAICEYRRRQGTDGPLFMGKDTHALSAAAQRTALEVLAANGVETVIQKDGGFTPTPVVSRAILGYNRGQGRRPADGIVITPSHNPPADGGIKYNPPNGGPADTDVTGWIQNRANELLRGGNREVKRDALRSAAKAATHARATISCCRTCATWRTVIDMEAIRSAGVRIGVDPLGGAAVRYWEPIRERYGLDLTVVNPTRWIRRSAS